MAEMNVSVGSPMDPETAWNVASDLNRLHEWLTIFGGWKSPVPSNVQEGTEVSMVVKVQAFRNVIDWTVIGYDPPTRLKMAGTGRGGVKLDLTVEVAPDDGGSRLNLHAELRGALLSGPIGRLVARVVTSDARKSIENLAALG